VQLAQRGGEQQCQDHDDGGRGSFPKRSTGWYTERGADRPFPAWKDLAAIVPMADLKLMEDIENQVLLREIQARKRNPKGKAISLAQLLKKYEE